MRKHSVRPLTTLIAGFGALLAVGFSAGAQATPLATGDVLLGLGNDVTAIYLGSNAGDTDVVSLLGGATLFVNNGAGATAVGSTVDLGTYAVGQTITFTMDNLTTATSFTDGQGALNPDGDVHALVTYDLAELLAMCNGSGCLSSDSIALANSLGPDTTFIGFEDLSAPQGSDFDYNDIVFAVQGAEDPAVPTPSSLALLVPALLGFFLLRRRSTPLV